MADDDEIDILGDFSFNSCFAQNNQGIPSCSNREDTVHPQWLLDSTANNWQRDSLARKMSESSVDRDSTEVLTTWNQMERDLLAREMAKYGRNTRKISETIKTKTEAEIQALIEAEYGVNLDTPIFGLEKNEEHGDVPAVVQEEIVTEDASNTARTTKKPFQKKSYNTKSKMSLLKSNVIENIKNDALDIKPSELIYEDDLIIGSTESIGSDMDLTDIVSKNIGKVQKTKIGKKIGNHRRKISRNYDNKKNKSKDLLKSPKGRQTKESSLSEDSAKSPKMQIVFSSGLALPVSEGEQVIKIAKKKDSESESDIDIDVDSGEEDDSSSKQKEKVSKSQVEEAPIAMPLRKFEPMPRRQKKKINLDGGGGFTIMHTENGDLYEIASEPRKERQARKQPIHLIECHIYNADRPAPFFVSLHVSALISMDVHGHSSRGEVMGLVGGEYSPPHLTVAAYRHAAAAAGSTHCDMDPVSQSLAGCWLQSLGHTVCGWHHSHPRWSPAPSALDLRSQRAFQRALHPAPALAIIISQHWPPGRDASRYRCLYIIYLLANQ
ncbi:unnamed protein product [Chilo suppressalis]|uniref:Uncharacterized protein n=1 Tax=Chilo suppressalis TaxID=168631 RepID=A0ABN8L0R8_CHISP|nr:unnamed protein product [Chilo suppressalis]